MHKLNKLNDKLEKFQRQLENEAEGAGEVDEDQQQRLNTIQENLTKITEETVEDLPFSKFLVRINCLRDLNTHR